MKSGSFSRRALLMGATATLALPKAIQPAAAFGTGRHAGEKRPNILFILADDMGYADLSCYGRTDYQTPVIDGLARGGMQFMHAYANSAVCSATRTALITGRYQYRLPVGLEEPLAGRDVGLPPEHPTLPSLLRAAGYSTALVGKWHLGNLPKYGPRKSGYEHFWGFRGGGVDYFTHGTTLGKDLWDGERLIEREGYLTDLLGDQAISAVDRFAKTKRPFFMSLHFNAPHWPWEGPDDEAESRYLAEKKQAFDTMFHYDGGDIKTYAAMVTRMDMQIGRVCDALRRNGILDDTIIVFTSDNGGERFSNTWPFTGKKGELLEGGLRIPAIVHWPARVTPGSKSDQTMMSMDWLPTLLAITGASPNSAFPPDGMNLLPVLEGRAATDRALYWRYLNMAQEACREGEWKYLKILENTFLFNVVQDPLERANLKEREPAIYQRLVDQYRAWDRQMLPLDPASFTMGFKGKNVADHFGATAERLTQ